MRVFDAGVPVLGICYGMQLMADALGGRVAHAPQREYGHALIRVEREAPLFASVADELRVWASHGDFVQEAPTGFSVLATSANAPVAAMEDRARGLYALLFHPEVAHTDQGLEILRNFAYGICGCTGDWTMTSFIDETIGRIRAQVGEQAGRVCPERRGRFHRRGHSHPSRDRRPADLHLRRQRRAAARRGGSGHEAIREASAAGRLCRRVGRSSSNGSRA